MEVSNPRLTRRGSLVRPAPPGFISAEETPEGSQVSGPKGVASQPLASFRGGLLPVMSSPSGRKRSGNLLTRSPDLFLAGDEGAASPSPPTTASTKPLHMNANLRRNSTLVPLSVSHARLAEISDRLCKTLTNLFRDNKHTDRRVERAMRKKEESSWKRKSKSAQAAQQVLAKEFGGKEVLEGQGDHGGLISSTSSSGSDGSSSSLSSNGSSSDHDSTSSSSTSSVSSLSSTSTGSFSSASGRTSGLTSSAKKVAKKEQQKQRRLQKQQQRDHRQQQQQLALTKSLHGMEKNIEHLVESLAISQRTDLMRQLQNWYVGKTSSPTAPSPTARASKKGGTTSALVGAPEPVTLGDEDDGEKVTKMKNYSGEALEPAAADATATAAAICEATKIADQERLADANLETATSAKLLLDQQLEKRSMKTFAVLNQFCTVLHARSEAYGRKAEEARERHLKQIEDEMKARELEIEQNSKREKVEAQLAERKKLEEELAWVKKKQEMRAEKLREEMRGIGGQTIGAGSGGARADGGSGVVADTDTITTADALALLSAQQSEVLQLGTALEVLDRKKASLKLLLDYLTPAAGRDVEQGAAPAAAPGTAGSPQPKKSSLSIQDKALVVRQLLVEYLRDEQIEGAEKAADYAEQSGASSTERAGNAGAPPVSGAAAAQQQQRDAAAGGGGRATGISDEEKVGELEQEVNKLMKQHRELTDAVQKLSAAQPPKQSYLNDDFLLLPRSQWDPVVMNKVKKNAQEQADEEKQKQRENEQTKKEEEERVKVLLEKTEAHLKRIEEEKTKFLEAVSRARKDEGTQQGVTHTATGGVVNSNMKERQQELLLQLVQTERETTSEMKQKEAQILTKQDEKEEEEETAKALEEELERQMGQYPVIAASFRTMLNLLAAQNGGQLPMQHFGDGTSFFENNDDIEENHILELQAEREELVSFRLELGNKLSMEARKLQLVLGPASVMQALEGLCAAKTKSKNGETTTSEAGAAPAAGGGLHQHQAASGVGGALSDEAAELQEIMRSVGAMAAEDSKLAEMEKDSRFPELVRLQGENAALQRQVEDFDERLKALKAGAAGAGGGGGKEKDAKVGKGAARGAGAKGKTSGPASPSSPASPGAAARGFSKEDPSEADAAGVGAAPGEGATDNEPESPCPTSSPQNDHPDAKQHAARSKCKSPKAGKKGAQPSSAAPPQPSATDAAAAVVADLLPTGRGFPQELLDTRRLAKSKQLELNLLRDRWWNAKSNDNALDLLTPEENEEFEVELREILEEALGLGNLQNQDEDKVEEDKERREDVNRLERFLERRTAHFGAGGVLAKRHHSSSSDEDVGDEREQECGVESSKNEQLQLALMAANEAKTSRPMLPRRGTMKADAAIAKFFQGTNFQDLTVTGGGGRGGGRGSVGGPVSRAGSITLGSPRRSRNDESKSKSSKSSNPTSDRGEAQQDQRQIDRDQLQLTEKNKSSQPAGADRSAADSQHQPYRPVPPFATAGEQRSLPGSPPPGTTTFKPANHANPNQMKQDGRASPGPAGQSRGAAATKRAQPAAHRDRNGLATLLATGQRIA